MPKTLFVFLIFLISVFILSGCRPPDLEGAYLQIKNKNWDEALTLAEKVTKEYPENAEGWYTLGRIYGKKDRIKDMLDAYEKCLNLDKSYQKKIKDEKFDYYAKKFNAGVAKYNEYLDQNDQKSDKSVAIMEESIKDFTQSNLLNPSYRSVVLIAQGNNLIGRNEEALKNFKNLTTNYPDSADAWINLGKYYYNTKDYEQAISNFKKAVEIDTNSSDAYTFVAQSYDFLEKPKEAIPYYKKAVKLNKKDSAVSFNLGLLYYKQAIKTKDTDEKNADFLNSVKYFDISIKQNPDYLNSYQLKGNAELLLQKFEDAKNTLETGVQKFPEDYQMWNDLSICYARLNEAEKAKQAEAKAKALK